MTGMSAKTWGQVAYEKWRELLPYPNLQLEWEKLPKSAKEGWEEIVLAVLDHFDFRN
jgi:hypothetical protein